MKILTTEILSVRIQKFIDSMPEKIISKILHLFLSKIGRNIEILTGCRKFSSPSRRKNYFISIIDKQKTKSRLHKILFLNLAMQDCEFIMPTVKHLYIKGQLYCQHILALFQVFDVILQDSFKAQMTNALKIVNSRVGR